MKWHNGLPPSWDDLPDLSEDSREVVPMPGVPARQQREVQMDRLARGLCLREVDSDSAWIRLSHGDGVRLSEAR